MKNVALLIYSLMIAYTSFAQKTETFLSLNSGLFSFRGVSADKNSQINLSNNNTGYTNNPFGAKNGLSYGLSYQLQVISKSNFVAGVSLGYENLRSKTTIDAVNGFDGQSTFQNAASGRTNLSNHFINGFPFLGYRINTPQVSIDITGGLDLGYLFSSKENGKAVGTNGSKYSSSLDRTGINFDVRPRLQLSASRAKIGAYVGYSYGLMNYRSGWVGGKNQCSSELIRFGILYKLKG